MKFKTIVFQEVLSYEDTAKELDNILNEQAGQGYVLYKIYKIKKYISLLIFWS